MTEVKEGSIACVNCESYRDDKTLKWLPPENPQMFKESGAMVSVEYGWIVRDIPRAQAETGMDRTVALPVKCVAIRILEQVVQSSTSHKRHKLEPAQKAAVFCLTCHGYAKWCVENSATLFGIRI